MFSEHMQLTDEEIDIKDEPLFPSSENDKVGWIILDIVELFIGSDGSRALYLRYRERVSQHLVGSKKTLCIKIQVKIKLSI